VGHRLLIGRKPAVDEEGLEALAAEPATAEECRLLGRAAEVEAGDDPQDTDQAQ
jgi:hypothetical protein